MIETMPRDIPEGFYVNEAGIIVPRPLPKPKRKYPVGIDMFCGCGGFSLGVIQAGFEVIAGFDNEPHAAFTYMMNLGTYPMQIHYAEPKDKDILNRVVERGIEKEAKLNGGIAKVPTTGSGWRASNQEYPGVSHMFFGDVTKWSGDQILEIVGLEKGELDFLFGGPPCQGFSFAGKRDVADPRNNMVFEFARFINEINPKTICMENVPGLLSMVTPEGMNVVDQFCLMIQEGGWSTAKAIKSALTGFTGARAAVRRRQGTIKEEAVEEESFGGLFDEED